MKDVVIQLEDEAAEKFAEQGYAELVMRAMDGSYQSFIKAFLSDPNVASETLVKIIHVLDEIAPEASFIHDAVRIVDAAGEVIAVINREFPQIADATKQLVEQIKKTDVAEALSKIKEIVMAIPSATPGINIYYAMTTACMSIVMKRFDAIDQKLNVMDKKLDVINKKLDQAEKTRIATILSEYKNLISRFNVLSQEISDGDPIDEKELNKLINDIDSMFDKLMGIAGGDLDVTFALQLVFTLLPAYTQLVNLNLRLYTFEKHKPNALYASRLAVYDRLASGPFLSELGGILFLNDDNAGARAILADLNEKKRLLKLNRQQVEDQAKLLELAPSREEYERLMLGITQATEEQVFEMVPEITQKSGLSEEECKDALHEAMLAFAAV